MKSLLVLATIFIGLPLFAMAQSQRSAATVDVQANEFMDHYWSELSGPNNEALRFIRTVAADEVDFYGQSLSRDSYVKTEESFLDRWPYRQYFAGGLATCDYVKATCELTGEGSLKASSPDRGVSTQASINYDFTVRYKLRYGRAIFHIVAVAGPSGGGVGQVSDLKTGSLPYVSLNLPAPQIQEIGCLGFNMKQQHDIEVHSNCNAVTAIDLTGIYHTHAKWYFIVTQKGVPTSQNDLQFIFLKNDNPIKVDMKFARFAGGYPQGYCLNEMRSVSLLDPTKSKIPLIVVYADCADGAPNTPAFLGIWTFDRNSQQFEMIWGSFAQCGEDVRLFTSGALAGDIVSYIRSPSNGTYPPSSERIIKVYRLMSNQHFLNLLSFRDQYKPTDLHIDTCADYDPFSGVDSELPKIFYLLGIIHKQ